MPGQQLVEVPFTQIAWTQALESIAGRCRVIIVLDKTLTQAKDKEVMDAILYALGQYAGNVDPLHIATGLRGQRHLLQFLKENWTDADPGGLAKLLKL